MKTTRLGAACAGILMVIGGAVQAAPISGQGTWETTLQGRDLDGNLATFEAYYDTVLDITWLADASYAYTSGYHTSDLGRMTWANATAWAAGLNPYASGITGWRLPNTNPVNGISYIYPSDSYVKNGSADRGYNISAPGTVYTGSTGSEMAHLFYNTLGNKSVCDPVNSTASTCIYQPGWGLTNTGPFSNIRINNFYWSATWYPPDTSNAWAFDFRYGPQYYIERVGSIYAWAVHDGDVGASAVPVPATAWLFGSGLIGLLGAARRRH